MSTNFRHPQPVLLSNLVHRRLISGVILAALPSPTPPGLWVTNKHLAALRYVAFTLSSPDQPLQQGGNLCLFATERLLGETIINSPSSSLFRSPFGKGSFGQQILQPLAVYLPESSLGQ